MLISYVWIGGCWKYGCEVCCDEKGRLQLTPNREYTFLLNEDRICWMELFGGGPTFVGRFRDRWVVPSRRCTALFCVRHVAKTPFHRLAGGTSDPCHAIHNSWQTTSMCRISFPPSPAMYNSTVGG
jgi:hypothetical protein